MKNTILKLSLAVALLMQTVSIAQNKSNSSSSKIEKGPHAFKKGGMDLNIGLGLGYSYGRYYTSYMPPLNLALDYGVTDNVSIGGFFGYTRAKWGYTGIDYYQGNSYNYSYSYKWSFYMLGLRGAYHFGDILKIEKLDVYVGAALGNSFVKRTYTYSDPYRTRPDYYNSTSSQGGGIIWGLYGGGRYFFNEKIGVFGEFGYGISYGNIGLTIKLK